MRMHRVTTPPKASLNPSFSVGGLDPDERNFREWSAKEQDSCITGLFRRSDNDLLNLAPIQKRPMIGDEKIIFPRPNKARTQAINAMFRQLEGDGKLLVIEH